MITRIVDEGGIEAIRANSHRYVTQGYSALYGRISLKQLNDSDGTLYADGTDASSDITSNDVWMKLPQFWYKCTQYATDKWDFTVSYGGKPDDTFKEWDGKDLIGVYEAYSLYDKDGDEVDKIHSWSGVTSSGSIAQSDFYSYARNKYIAGGGYETASLVKWKHHCMMGMLFYTYYGTTNSQAVCGSGTSAYDKTTGGTDTLGMEDTVAGGDGDSGSINFWGLEDWWGNKYEWIDDVILYNKAYQVSEEDGSRVIGVPVASSGYISKMLFGENIDLVPTAVDGSTTTGFCDYHYYGSGTNVRVMARSSGNADVDGGVAYVDSGDSSSDIHVDVGSRLAYRGEYEIVS